MVLDFKSQIGVKLEWSVILHLIFSLPIEMLQCQSGALHFCFVIFQEVMFLAFAFVNMFVSLFAEKVIDRFLVKISVHTDNDKWNR